LLQTKATTIANNLYIEGAGAVGVFERYYFLKSINAVKLVKQFKVLTVLRCLKIFQSVSVISKWVPRYFQWEGVS
jgi:hypothetical protein